MTFLLAMFQSKLARQIGAALALVASVLTFGAIQKRKGANQERADQKEADNENAGEIRDRVRAAKSIGVSSDDIKYRNN